MPNDNMYSFGASFLTSKLSDLSSKHMLKIDDKVKKKNNKTLKELFEEVPEPNISSLIGDHIVSLQKPENKINVKIEDDEKINHAGYPDIYKYFDLYNDLDDGITAHIREVGERTGKKIITKNINTSLEFITPEYKDKFVQEISGYFTKYFRGSFVKLNELNLPVAVLTIEGTMPLITSVTIQGNMEVVYDVTKIFIDHLDTARDLGKVTVITSVGEDGLKTRTVTLPRNVRTATAAFYPWMDGLTPEEYIQDFLNSDEPFLFLYGEPGTAKSTLLKTAIANLGLNALMSANSRLNSDAAFVSRLLQHLGKNNYDIAVLEDADAMLRPREEGNLELNELLSAIDGIGSMPLKVVVICNQDDTSKIDPAILRHGRCYDIMKFGRLTPVQGNNARVSIGLPPVNLVNNLTLAFALNADDQSGMRSAQNENHTIVAPRFPLKDLKG